MAKTLSQVPFYESDESDKDNENDDAEVNKKRKLAIEWVFEKEYANLKEAESERTLQKIWSYLKSHDTATGTKRYFRCNLVKRRGEQCASAIYFLYDAYSEKVLRFKTKSSHNHDSLQKSSKRGIDEKIREEIVKLVDLQLKPKQITNALVASGLKDIPSKNQLNNYVAHVRNLKLGPSSITVGELQKWLEESSMEQTDLHEPFVMSWVIDQDDIDNIKFRFFLSTKKLINHAVNAATFHADATYKLVWQGFPILIIGTTDKKRKFHPFGLSVCSNECTEDFSFLFSAIKDATKKFYSTQTNPDNLVADGAKSIHNAFLDVFGGDKKIVMCWFHAKKAMKNKVLTDISQNRRTEIVKDIDELHLAASDEIFEKASILFLEKWKEFKDFCTYFDVQWLQKNRNWFLGAACGAPTTNNALEAFNRVIKDSHTLRERLPLGRFANKSKEILKFWSMEYEIGHNNVSDTPDIPLFVWKTSFHWAKLKKQIIVSETNENIYLVPAKLKEAVPTDIPVWNSFNEYKTNAFLIYYVELPSEAENWTKGKCSCPAFHQYYMCKHIIGLSIRKKFVVPPPEANDILIEPKRKRGRPAKAKKALVFQ